MDHFETFDPDVEPFRVECLFHKASSLSYDFLGFEGFPERKGWMKSYGSVAGLNPADPQTHPEMNEWLKLWAKRTGLDIAHSQAEVDEFLQSWLYLGFLHDWTKIVGLPLDLNHFIRSDAEDDEKKWITTTMLPAYCATWVLQEEGLSEHLSETEYQQHKQSCVDRLRPLLRDVLMWTQTLLNWKTAPVPVDHSSSVDTLTSPRRLISPELSTAIFALRLSISSTAKHVWNLPSTEGIGPDFEGRSLFLARLLDNGWCPHDVRYLGTTVTLDACYYVCSYYPARALRDHGQCDEYHCQADFYDNSEGYQCRHADKVQDCNCSLQGPSLEELLRGFDFDGGFPLLTVKKGFTISMEEIIEVVVLPFDPSHPVDYIAFSHVWADGLGNPVDNTLPTCQLCELQRMANDAYHFGTTDEHTDPIPFWIDTLCVPVRDDLVDHRKLAIQRMRSTYQKAEKVLVLDQEILSGSINASPRERIVRIVLSTWMRRLWTFQEGFLAKHLLFQFRDGCYLMNDIYRAEKSRPESCWSVGGLALASLFISPMILSKTEAHPDRIFTCAFDGLQWRSTTRAGDETLCLAVLMGIDPLPLLNVASRSALRAREDSRNLLEKRMQVLLQLIRRIPPGVIFLSGQRLSQDGYKWAPTALLGLNQEDVCPQPLRRTYIASLHRERLVAGAEPSNMAELIEGGGLRLMMLSITLPSFEHGKIDTQFKVVHRVLGKQSESYEIRIFDNGEARDSAIGKDGNGMVILMNNPVIAHRDPSRCSQSIAGLVSLRDDDTDEYRKVDFVCRVTVTGNQIFDVPNSELDALVITDQADLDRPWVICTDSELQVLRKWEIL